MKSFLSGVAKEILDLVFPPACLICRDKSRESICPRCRGAFEYLTGPLCHHCGSPPPPQGTLCKKCLQNPPPYEIARSVLYYSGILKKSLTAMKFHDKIQLAPFLSKYLTDYLSESNEFSDVEVLVPVPGRNGAAHSAGILCGYLKKTTGLSCVDALVRRHDVPQHRMNFKNRWDNAQKAFGPARENEINRKQVLLIDDIFTSGATAYHCSRILLNQGAARVKVLTLARTPAPVSRNMNNQE